jgi:hypothetical protein
MSATFLIYLSCFFNVFLSAWILYLRRKLRAERRALIDTTKTWRNLIAKMGEAQHGL